MYVTVTHKRHDTYPFEVGSTIEVEDKIYPPFFMGDTEYPNGYYTITNPRVVGEGQWVIDINDIKIEKQKQYKLSKFRFI